MTLRPAPARALALLALAGLAALAPASAAVAQAGATMQPAAGPDGKQAPMPAELNVGDAAPPIAIEHWAKGAPVAKFEKGKAYVVEFWATWCGPCIRGIPHLSELQAKHKDKVTFIGVSTDTDKGKTARELVDAFVAKMGDKMAYTVALDKGGQTASAYLGGVRVGSIPHAFIVDQNGKMVWHGNPLNPNDEFEPTLDAVAAGTFDLSKRKEYMDARQRLQNAADAKDWAAAGKALDEIETLRPDQANEIALNRYTLHSLAGDKTKAMAQARKLGDETFKADGKMLQQLTQRMLGTEWLAGPDLDYAVGLARRSLTLNGDKDAMSYMLLTEGLAKQGKNTEAADAARKGLEASTEMQQRVYFEGRINELDPKKPETKPESKP